MRIVTHHKGHEIAAQQTGFTMINNLRFEYDHTTGETATVTRVNSHHCEMFVGAEGYSFYHDDGTYSGPSLKKSTTITTGAAEAASTPAAPTPAQAALAEALQNGTATLEELKAMGVDVSRFELNAPALTIDQTVSMTAEVQTQETGSVQQQAAEAEGAGTEGDGAGQDTEAEATPDKPWQDMAWRPTGDDTPVGEWTANQLKGYLELKGKEFDARASKPALLDLALEAAGLK